MDRRGLLLGALGAAATSAVGAQNPERNAAQAGTGQPARPPAQPVTPTYDYDLILQGGRVLDPANQVDAVRDIGIRGGKITAISKSLPAKRARRVLSVRGRLVTPGLVDIHVHGFGYQGSVTLDEHAFMNGTTTVVDAGGAGWRTYEGLVRAVLPRRSFGGRGGGRAGGLGPQGGPGGGQPRGLDGPPRGAGQPGGELGGGGPGGGFGGGAGAGFGGFDPARMAEMLGARLRVFAFLNIVGEGMVGGRAENNMEDMDPEKAAACVQAHPEFLVGIKTAHFGGPRGPEGWTAVNNAVAAGRLCKKPVMVDFSPREDRPYAEMILKRMRPGDIHTHVFAAHIPVLDESGKVQAYLHEARQRGVLFDVGHGGGSFWFRVAAPAIRQGFWPDSISTDMHRSSLLIPQSTMPLVMSKLLNLGMSLPEVILRSTNVPARQIGHPELGTLAVGAGADIAVFEIEEGDFGFIDSGRASMRGKKRLRCHLTLRDGVVAYDLNGLSWKDYREAGPYRNLDQYGEDRRRGFRRPGAPGAAPGGAGNPPGGPGGPIR